MRAERGVTLMELAVLLAVLALGVGLVVPTVGEVLPKLRAHGATADLYGAVHLTRARARETGVMHALMIEPDGRGFRIVEDPAGAARTAVGPLALGDGATASANVILRFTPKGFAVPAGTITVRSGDQVRRVIVNILGRVRVASG